jgi:hypothetical protein
MSFRGGKAGQYTCQRYADGKTCEAPVLIAGAKIDALVEERFLERHAGSGGAGDPADREEFAAAERELEVAIADLQATAALDFGGKAGEALAATLEVKAKRVEDAEVALEELRSSSSLDRRLARIGERWGDFDLEGKRRLLTAAVASVTVHRVGPGSRVPLEERASIVFAGEAATTSDAGQAAA